MWNVQRHLRSYNCTVSSTNLVRLLCFCTTVCLIIALTCTQFNPMLWKVNHSPACFWCISWKNKKKHICLGKIQTTQKEWIILFLINNWNARPIMIASVFQFSNINTSLTTQHGCCLPYWQRWHIVVTRDSAYVCRTNGTHHFSSFSLLWTRSLHEINLWFVVLSLMKNITMTSSVVNVFFWSHEWQTQYLHLLKRETPLFKVNKWGNWVWVACTKDCGTINVSQVGTVLSPLDVHLSLQVTIWDNCNLTKIVPQPW